eukprot:12980536-Alexandrium_andersonii.AAC.1
MYTRRGRRQSARLQSPKLGRSPKDAGHSAKCRSGDAHSATTSASSEPQLPSALNERSRPR